MYKAKDRLNELQKETKPQNETQIQIEDEKENEQLPEIREIFEKVQVIRLWIDSIKENTKILQDLTRNTMTSKKLLHDEIKNRVKNTTSIAFKITNKLKELDKDQSSGGKNRQVYNRMQKLQYASLRQEFQNAVFENNDVLEKYREKQRFLLQKQASLVNSALTQDEIEALIDNPNGGDMFTKNILLDMQIAKDELQMIEERHNELLKIEKLLEEVRDQFQQMAILVEQQKEHINRIEYHASDAITYVDQGLVEIEIAAANKKKYKKKVIIIVVIAIIIAIFLTLIFVKT